MIVSNKFIPHCVPISSFILNEELNKEKNILDYSFHIYIVKAC